MSECLDKETPIFMGISELNLIHVRICSCLFQKILMKDCMNVCEYQ